MALSPGVASRLGGWPARASASLCAALALTLAPRPAGAQLDTVRRWLGLEHAQRPWTGDLDGMIERRRIRLLVVPSRTFYFVDRGTQRGIDYDLGQEIQKEINQKRGRKLLAVEVVYVPVRRDEILPALLQGKGDVAAANLTITPEREQWVDFSAPLVRDASEIVVTGPSSPQIRGVDDLAGQEVFVRLSSSYFQSLWHLNQAFGQRGLPPVRVRAAPEELEDEDLLEMVSAGLVGIAVVDDHKAEFWAQVLPKLVLHPDATVRSGVEIALAFRKQSPQLRAFLDDFSRRHGKGTLFGNQKFRQYLQNTQYVKDATSQEEYAKLLRMIQVFQKYGTQYDFDWLMLAAQGYQESRLDQKVKSRVGAVGVMQVMPSTGKEMGVGDIQQTEANIHAGTKYLRGVLDRYFADAELDGLNRQLFAFASYNAGPAKIAKLRKEAGKRGLDPNVWFNNVERVAAERVGQEPVRYVANIYKYYVAYRLVVDAQAERDQARETAKGS
jgi:membrane-bound lytic murein transglycosylase MltF